MFFVDLAIFGQNSEKIAKQKILVEKFFLVGIDSEYFEKRKNENLEIEKFSHDKIFFVDLVVFWPK